MSEPKHSTLWLSLQLFRLWALGWRQVPGYTVAEKSRDGDVYIAVQMTREK
jgi:hypothetical protein